jgi:hypothetical protein
MEDAEKLSLGGGALNWSEAGTRWAAAGQVRQSDLLRWSVDDGMAMQIDWPVCGWDFWAGRQRIHGGGEREERRANGCVFKIRRDEELKGERDVTISS